MRGSYYTALQALYHYGVGMLIRCKERPLCNVVFIAGLVFIGGLVTPIATEGHIGVVVPVRCSSGAPQNRTEGAAGSV